MGHTITRVEHNNGGTPRSIEGHHSLDGHIHSWSVERLKHDLGHLFFVGLGVERSPCEQNWVLLEDNSQLTVESVMPNLHVILVGNDSAFEGVFRVRIPLLL